MSILNNEITTPRQAKNGTRAFLCNRTGSTYLSYASGYVRRCLPSNEFRTIGYYQLNKRSITVLERTTFNGKTFKTCQTKRIMIPNESDRLALIEHRAASYRTK
jgi:hypothetical protein